MNESGTMNYASVNRAFSKQAVHYDADDAANPILVDWRTQVYAHVDQFLKPGSSILELNAGTGIDAIRFVEKGHRVYATDVAAGMITEIQKKISRFQLQDQLTSHQLSFDQLDQLAGKKFDYIFSNFGGLNCIADLSKVTRHFHSLLNPGGCVTLIIMPPVCLWEWLWIFRGHGKMAFRRLRKNGTTAHLEGEYFQTFYHSLSSIKKSLAPSFKFIKVEGLGVLSPPPSRGDFPIQHQWLFQFLRRLDVRLGSTFPFNRWADHVIVSFQKSMKPESL